MADQTPGDSHQPSPNMDLAAYQKPPVSQPSQHPLTTTGAVPQGRSIGLQGRQEHSKVHGSQANGIRKPTSKPPVRKKLANLTTPERPMPGLGKTTRPREPHMPGLAQRAFLNELIPPCNLGDPTPNPPPPSVKNILERNGCVRWEADLARHLYSHNVMGLYKIGDWLCDVHAASGKFMKFAARDVTPDGKFFWRHAITKQRVHSVDGNGLNGRVVHLSNGAFAWMEDSKGIRIVPEWQFASPADLNGESKEPDVKEEMAAIPGLKSGCDPMWF